MSKYRHNSRATNKLHKAVKEGPVIPELHHFEDKDLNVSVASRTMARGRPDEGQYGRVPITLDLQGPNGEKMIFDGKGWASEGGTTLQEENNMLKFKIEVLLDLYASTRADFNKLKEHVRLMDEYAEGLPS